MADLFVRAAKVNGQPVKRACELVSVHLGVEVSEKTLRQGLKRAIDDGEWSTEYQNADKTTTGKLLVRHTRSGFIFCVNPLVIDVDPDA